MRLWRRADRLIRCGSADECAIQAGEPYSVRDDGRLIRCQQHSPTPLLNEAQLEAFDERRAIQQEASRFESVGSLVRRAGLLSRDGKMRSAGND